MSRLRHEAHPHTHAHTHRPTDPAPGATLSQSPEATAPPQRGPPSLAIDSARSDAPDRFPGTTRRAPDAQVLASPNAFIYREYDAITGTNQERYRIMWDGMCPVLIIACTRIKNGPRSVRQRRPIIPSARICHIVN